MLNVCKGCDAHAKGCEEKGLSWVCKAAGGELKLRVGKAEALRRLAALAFNLDDKHCKHSTYDTLLKDTFQKRNDFEHIQDIGSLTTSKQSLR